MLTEHGFRATNERLATLTDEFHELREEIRGGLTARVVRLEDAVFRPPGARTGTARR
jgi:hypothetical protein